MQPTRSPVLLTLSALMASALFAMVLLAGAAHAQDDTQALTPGM